MNERAIFDKASEIQDLGQRRDISIRLARANRNYGPESRTC